VANKSKIEWTDATWNPVTGCSKISEGCRHCYAERLAKRLQAMGNPSYLRGFEIALHRHLLDLPLRWQGPRSIFVNSMSDLFHERVPEEFILQVFDTMQRAPRHRFQVLTKRSRRLAELAAKLVWPDNVWMGVTIENVQYADRTQDLKNTDARVKFLSLEPLLGPIGDFDLSGIDWVIVGGESGPGARLMQQSWVTAIRDRCAHAGVPFFFKQWGGVRKKQAGRLLDGRTWDQVPQC
jgi:protein gp37